MSTFLPTQYLDETFYSLVARIHLLSGNTNSRETLRCLFGIDTVFPLSTLPSHLKEFAINTGLTDIRGLVENHTLVPYFRPFSTRKSIERLEARMLGVDGGAVKIGLGLPASRIGAAESLRYCTECCREDSDVHGIAYWHRIHQLPGVLVCPTHKEPLLELNSAEVRAGYSLILPPHHDKSVVDVIFHKYSIAEKLALTILSANSASLLLEKLPSLPPDLLRAVYFDVAVQRGWAHGNSRIHPSCLLAVINELLQAFPNVPPFASLRINEKSEDAWALRLLRSPRKNVHPLKHILLIQALFGGISNFLMATANYTEKVNGETHAKPSRQQKQLDHPAAKILPRLSVSQRRCINRILRQGNPVIHISHLCDVSVPGIYRYIRSNVSLRKEWRIAAFLKARNTKRLELRVLLHKQSKLARNELREKHAALYAWFYRNDRKWFYKSIEKSTHTHITKQVDWHERDRCLSSQIHEAANSIRNTPCRPMRVTASGITRKLGCVTRVEKCIAKLPRTAVAISAEIESADEFRRRRIRWAVTRLSKEVGGLTLWRIFRYAGIRKEYCQTLKPYVRTLMSQIMLRTNYQ